MPLEGFKKKNFKLDFKKVDFQKMGISLISLGKEIECYLFYPKRTEANFVPNGILLAFVASLSL